MKFGHVYVLCVRTSAPAIFKVGMSTHLRQRIKHLEWVHTGGFLLFSYDVPIADTRLAESVFHRKFRDVRIPNTCELFTLRCDDILWLMQDTIVLIPDVLSVKHSSGCPECAWRTRTGKTDLLRSLDHFLFDENDERELCMNNEATFECHPLHPHDIKFEEGWLKGHEDEIDACFAHPPISFKKKKVN